MITTDKANYKKEVIPSWLQTFKFYNDFSQIPTIQREF